MEQLLPLLIWVVISLVTIIPVYVGFKILDSSATFHNMARGTKLGGAIAAYFVIWTTGAVMYNQLVLPPSDPVNNVKSEIVGAWDCEATVDGRVDNNGRVIFEKGEMYVNMLESGRMSISGTTASKTWNADIIIMDEARMVFIFHVPVSSTAGVTILRFRRNGGDEIHSMSGFWGLTGVQGKGSVKCERTN